MNLSLQDSTRSAVIAHVLPNKPKKEWFSILTKNEHENCKDILANSILLSQRMNQSLQNDTSDNKRPVYLKDSMFKSTREFANDVKK